MKDSLLSNAVQMHDIMTAPQETFITEGFRVAAAILAEAEVGSPLAPEDYNFWMQTIQDLADERGIKLSNVRAFHNLAYEVLDDDPRMDEFGNDETTKQHIVSALHRSMQASISHDKASEYVGKFQRKRRLSGGGLGAEEEEENATALIPLERQKEEIRRAGHDTGSDHMRNGKGHRGSRSNPYLSGTKRYNWFAAAYDHGYSGDMLPQPTRAIEQPCELPPAASGGNSSPAMSGAEDENLSEPAPTPTIDDAPQSEPLEADKEGFLAAAMDAVNGQVEQRTTNPHSSDTPEYSQWEDGYARFTAAQNGSAPIGPVAAPAGPAPAVERPSNLSHDWV